MHRNPSAHTAWLGLIQTLSRLCSLQPDFGRNADWLLEQCLRIWLAVEINGSWKCLFLSRLFSWMIRRRRRERWILLSFLLFYGLMVVKYALICAMESYGNSENSYGCSYLLRICFIYGKWVYRGVESLCKLLTANKVPFDLPTNECKSKYCPS